ncbi:cob(II)yrinic acid a,c-diamide reductase [Burkholderia pseudomultivorans]|uniref:Cob(II)yrinic acid a,c-diamide reductase n=1 Tax=Burkholderia pseudomultivorans TaxID=1207504 RepID=A0A6P2MFM9_9BURK|nr:5,6-dimethylbenzimidazole synthase [Burkholderia pseudomultivorans]VWB84263.1 cob(II)yrinic acid a,c-diamide reductase [Burkholderia pseudomultivorans]
MRFDDPDLAAVYRAIFERRDMRHFTPAPVDPAVLGRLLRAAHHAPSVGFMQPWRFVRITDRALRTAIHALVEAERRATADALGERHDDFMRLKVEGVRECGELLVVALSDDRERHVFGRRTLPEMDLASAACAIQNMWLAARAEGLGMGWVSLFDVDALRTLLGMPDGAKPIAVLCIGHVDAFYAKPMLEEARWAARMPIDACLFENGWGEPAAQGLAAAAAVGFGDASGSTAASAISEVPTAAQPASPAPAPAPHAPAPEAAVALSATSAERPT